MFGRMESATPAVPSMPRAALRWQWSQLPGPAAFERRRPVAGRRARHTFYASLGFRAASAPYDEDGILHVDMILDAA